MTRNDQVLTLTERTVVRVPVLLGLVVWLPLSLSSGCRFADKSAEVATELRQLETEPWGEPASVVARVNGREITRGEFYLRVLRRFGTMKLLAGLIKEELFLQEASRLGLSVEQPELDTEVDQIIDEMAQKAGGRDKLELQYARDGLSPAMIRRDLEREVSTQLLIGEVTRAHRNITDDVLMNYYKRTRRYKRFEARQIAYSFSTDDDASRLDALQRASRAAGLVRAGADFAELARAESEDPVTAPQGGRLGEVHQDTPMKPTLAHFKEAMMALDTGEVSDPVENPDGGYHIFQVTAIRESQSFVECREELLKELQEMDPDVREIEALLRKLQGTADVEVLNTPFEDRRARAPSRSEGSTSGPPGAGAPARK